MTDTATKSRSHKYTTREALLQPMLAHAAFDGWSATSFEAARKEAGISAGDAELACPRKELDLLAHWSRKLDDACLLYTSPSPRDRTRSRMPSSA